jgi:predicted HicB family RNase H-like nuclease
MVNIKKRKYTTEAVNTRVTPALKRALVKAAIQEKRSVSNLVIKVLSDFVEARVK